ncbi:MAG: hypothetical protein H6R05_63 [Burkholderiaceae bacterium]|nr:hypothetical protein [Burkholderiaceae bacterium]
MNAQLLRAMLLLLIYCVSSGIAVAKPQVFQWETELCRACATYDDQKISAHQLKATLDLNADRLISLYDDKNTQAQDDVEHERVQQFLRTPSNFIVHPAVEVVRQRMIERDWFFYKLDKVKRQARQTQDYRALDEFAPAQIPQCQAIAQTLQSLPSAQKTAAATRILSESCLDNGSPDECVARSLNRWAQSADAMNVELLTYHWGNCANHQQPDITDAERTASERVFKQNVGKVRYYDCEEP